MSHKFYNLYGLVIRSDIDLPEVRPETENFTHDVEIIERSVPNNLVGAETFIGYMDYLGEKCLYRIPEIGRFLVENGQRITVECEPGANPKDVRAFLFGSIFGTLLHQRKLVPMHVSGVATPCGVVAFTGESGAGKSTLAATVNNLTGWPIFCDDIAVLREIDGQPILESGMLRLKLWKDALERLNHDPKAVQQDATRFDKYHLDASDRIAQGKAPLAALVNLAANDQAALKTVSGAEAFKTLMNSIYRPYLVPMFSSAESIAQTMLRVLPTIQVFTFERPWSASELNSSAEILKKRFEAAPKSDHEDQFPRHEIF